MREQSFFTHGRPRRLSLGYRAKNDDTRLARVFVPRLRGTVYDTYDEYPGSGVAILGNFKSQWGDLGLNLTSQRGPQEVCIGPGASDLPEPVVLGPYK